MTFRRNSYYDSFDTNFEIDNKRIVENDKFTYKVENSSIWTWKGYFEKSFYLSCTFNVVIVNLKILKGVSLEVLVLSKCFKLRGIKFINIFFCFAVGTLSFTSNVVWENRSGCGNLERAIIPETLYEIFMSRMQ